MSLIAGLLDEQCTVEGVAQAAIDKICRAHHDEFIKSDGAVCQSREDMSLLVRLFGATVARSDGSPLTPGRGSPALPRVCPVSVPFSSSHGGHNHKLPPLIIPAISERFPLKTRCFSAPNSAVSTPISRRVLILRAPPPPNSRHLSPISG